jgi:hypothetical protein
MGSVDIHLATDLRNRLGLRRAVETGTYRGLTARSLSPIFDEVVTIELMPELHQTAAEALKDRPNVRAIQGHSVEQLREVRDAHVPTLYFLDGHWSGGETSGVDDECPVLRELDAIGPGNPADAFIVDDARLFTSAPPPPHRAEQWPTLMEVVDALRAQHPEHHITLLADQVIAVSPAARADVDAYGLRVNTRGTLGRLAAGVKAGRARVEAKVRPRVGG